MALGQHWLEPREDIRVGLWGLGLVRVVPVGALPVEALPRDPIPLFNTHHLPTALRRDIGSKTTREVLYLLCGFQTPTTA